MVKHKEREDSGFELIKQFVEKYPKTEHPTVDDDLVELFMNGARALGFNHILCVGDDTRCPECHEPNGKVEKEGLALDALIGNNVICHWCYVERDYMDGWHDTETCDHKPDDGSDGEWHREDCMAVLETFEHSYKAILEDEGWI